MMLLLLLSLIVASAPAASRQSSFYKGKRSLSLWSNVYTSSTIDFTSLNVDSW
jgi:hypothetical protein